MTADHTVAECGYQERDDCAEAERRHRRLREELGWLSVIWITQDDIRVDYVRADDIRAALAGDDR